jgi:hypothetical protein
MVLALAKVSGGSSTILDIIKSYPNPRQQKITSGTIFFNQKLPLGVDKIR